MLDGDNLFSEWGAQQFRGRFKDRASPQPRLNDTYCPEKQVEDFEKIWAIFPRKVAKHPARLEWARMSSEDQFAALHSLPVHIRYWQVSGVRMDYIPHLRTWLHQRRWEDELVMPAPTNEMGEWWKTTSGIQRKALSLGIAPKPGEDWHELKARILAKERAA